mgnify:CR=1 FL=1
MASSKQPYTKGDLDKLCDEIESRQTVIDDLYARVREYEEAQRQAYEVLKRICTHDEQILEKRIPQTDTLGFTVSDLIRYECALCRTPLHEAGRPAWIQEGRLYAAPD